jgi:hypothetical protein
MISNMLTIICAALPSFGFALPDFMGDFALICLALAGTAVAAVSSLVGPVFLLLGKAQSLFCVLFELCSGASSNLEEGVMSGIVGAATAGAFDSVVEIVEDGVMEHIAGDEEEDNGDGDGGGAGTAMAVGVGVGVAVAYGVSSRSKVAETLGKIPQGSAKKSKSAAVNASADGASDSASEGQEKEEKHGTDRLHRKKNVGCEVNSEFPPVHFTIKLDLLDFELVGYCFA